MTRLFLPLAALLLATGCIYVDTDDDRPGRNPPVNHPPIVMSADAWCSYSPVDNDDVISFQASVADADGYGDVVSVWADVYVEATGTLIDTFELYPTTDASVWFSDWLVSSTAVDCYYGGYVVDVTVYDNADAADVISVYPDTYR